MSILVPSLRVALTSLDSVLIVARATSPAEMSEIRAGKVGGGALSSSETTSRWATNTSRMTIRIGKAALLRNLFSSAPFRGPEGDALRRPPCVDVRTLHPAVASPMGRGAAAALTA